MRHSIRRKVFHDIVDLEISGKTRERTAPVITVDGTRAVEQLD